MDCFLRLIKKSLAFSSYFKWIGMVFNPNDKWVKIFKSLNDIIWRDHQRKPLTRYYVTFSVFYDFSRNVIFRKNFLMSMVYPSSPLLSPAGSVLRKENSLVPSGTSSFKTILLSLFFFFLSLFTENHPWNHGKERFFEHRGQLTIT